MNIEKQILHQTARVTRLNIVERESPDPISKRLIPVDTAILETLLAVRNIMHTRPDQVTDTTLTGQIEFILKEKQWNNVGLPSMKVMERRKMLDAIEETLCSYQHLANRMAEQLAELPGNTLKDAKPQGEWIVGHGPEPAPEVVNVPEPQPSPEIMDFPTQTVGAPFDEDLKEAPGKEQEFDPDGLEEQEPDDYEPDMMAPNAAERSEMLGRIQRDIK